MQARYYDPILARFLSSDPVPFSVARPEMFGRYTYAANDPVNMWDPDGRQHQQAIQACARSPQCATTAAGGAAVAVAAVTVANQSTTAKLLQQINGTRPGLIEMSKPPEVVYDDDGNPIGVRGSDGELRPLEGGTLQPDPGEEQRLGDAGRGP